MGVESQSNDTVMLLADEVKIIPLRKNVLNSNNRSNFAQL